jgi:hypothetical protein
MLLLGHNEPIQISIYGGLALPEDFSPTRRGGDERHDASPIVAVAMDALLDVTSIDSLQEIMRPLG